MIELRPCPFCGGKMEFCRQTRKNSRGNEFTEQYWIHAETYKCVLDEICMPFIIGAGDARVDKDGNPLTAGEYGDLWNKRVVSD